MPNEGAIHLDHFSYEMSLCLPIRVTDLTFGAEKIKLIIVIIQPVGHDFEDYFIFLIPWLQTYKLQ